MPSQETLINLLTSEGFKHVFTWHDEPGVVYPEHSHKDKVSIFNINGSVELQMNGETITLRPGERSDVPVGVPHIALVGLSGWECIVVEMIEEDS